jgi:hypothetical protein
VALLRGAGFRDLPGAMTVAEHLAGGGGVLWGEDEKCGTLVDSSQVPSTFPSSGY